MRHTLARLHTLTNVLRRFRRLIAIGILALVIVTMLLVLLRGYSALYAQDYIYTADEVPEKPVAIIFGAQVFRSGRPSAMLADRIKMGVELYHAGKVKALLMTGDNSVETYNEPEAMRNYAVSLGVPSDAIVLDYAGFRTYDSCYRARDIFKVDQAILVTQQFHLDRALLTCNSLGVESVGVAADILRPQGYSRSALLRSQVREFPSTLVSIADLLLGRKPTFLGDPLPIFPN